MLGFPVVLNRKTTNAAPFATIGGTLLPEAAAGGGRRRALGGNVFQSIFISNITNSFYLISYKRLFSLNSASPASFILKNEHKFAAKWDKTNL